MNITRGYLSVEAKIKFLGGKSLKDYASNKKLIFALETAPENIINVEAFGWKKNDDDEILINLPNRESKKIPYADREWLEEGQSIVGTSVKDPKTNNVVTLLDVDAVDFIHNNFKIGDSVFVNLKSEVDTYRNTLKWTISKFYPCNKEIDFESPDFEEVNNGVQWVIFDNVKDKVLNTFVIGKKDVTLPLVFELSPDLTAEDLAQFVAGDAINIDFELIRTPIYKEVEAPSPVDTKAFKPIGKYKDAPASGGKTFKTIEGFVEKYICVGIKDMKAQEEKIDSLRETENDDDIPF